MFEEHKTALGKLKEESILHEKVRDSFVHACSACEICI